MMTTEISWKSVKLTSEEYDKKIKSDSIIDKFTAIVYEIQNSKEEKFLFVRLVVYLEWFFDKVIERKIQDQVVIKRLQDFNFHKKMELMKDWGLLIDENFRDTDRIRIIRNEYAHQLAFDIEKIFTKLSELERYSEEQFKDLDQFDACKAIVVDIMSIFTNAINTGFQFKPTPKSKTM